MSVDYATILHGDGTDVEPNCIVCRARMRYCPGHDRPYYSAVPWKGIGGMGQPFILSPLSALVPGRYGSFKGDPVAQFSDDGSRLLFFQPFAYVDPRYHQWRVSRGAILDGFAIPRPFHTLIGDPFLSAYRYATIVHEARCRAQRDKWQDVHRMLYFACLASGVSRRLAKIIYYSVYHYGPRWAGKGVEYTLAPSRIADLLSDSVETIERYIVEDDPDLDEIRVMKPKGLGIVNLNARK